MSCTVEHGSQAEATLVRTLSERIAEELTAELVKPQFQGSHPLSGHCYVAAEALYHLLGGPKSGYRPAVVRVGEVTHWYLRCELGVVVDPTAAQFTEPVEYSKGRGCGFLTKKPSKRACIMIRRVLNLEGARIGT